MSDHDRKRFRRLVAAGYSPETARRIIQFDKGHVRAIVGKPPVNGSWIGDHYEAGRAEVQGALRDRAKGLR